jgi:hypothetical protein
MKIWGKDVVELTGAVITVPELGVSIAGGFSAGISQDVKQAIRIKIMAPTITTTTSLI